ncbi:hypothetical protein RRG08_002148 [Elysia crispata]|uniref:Uncharacterized protein n=1 Tax=Elysia crispata TaxID=231223 RepID=A0AAE1DCZ8_9GAST|nr:hypothetical protein RRG08_002148 [Elysia crispata]
MFRLTWVALKIIIEITLSLSDEDGRGIEVHGQSYHLIPFCHGHRYSPDDLRVLT